MKRATPEEVANAVYQYVAEIPKKCLCGRKLKPTRISVTGSNGLSLPGWDSAYCFGRSGKTYGDCNVIWTTRKKRIAANDPPKARRP